MKSKFNANISWNTFCHATYVSYYFCSCQTCSNQEMKKSAFTWLFNTNWWWISCFICLFGIWKLKIIYRHYYIHRYWSFFSPSVLKWKFQFNLIPFRSLFIEHSFKRLWEGFPKFSSVVIFGLFVDFQTFKWIWETHFLTYLEVIGFVWKISYKTNADLISKHHFLSYKNVAKLSWS